MLRERERERCLPNNTLSFEGEGIKCAFFNGERAYSAFNEKIPIPSLSLSLSNLYSKHMTTHYLEREGERGSNSIKGWDRDSCRRTGGTSSGKFI